MKITPNLVFNFLLPIFLLYSTYGDIAGIVKTEPSAIGAIILFGGLVAWYILLTPCKKLYSGTGNISSVIKMYNYVYFLLYIAYFVFNLKSLSSNYTFLIWILQIWTIALVLKSSSCGIDYQ
jgi:hypothetical protein